MTQSETAILDELRTRVGAMEIANDISEKERADWFAAESAKLAEVLAIYMKDIADLRALLIKEHHAVVILQRRLAGHESGLARAGIHYTQEGLDLAVPVPIGEIEKPEAPTQEEERELHTIGGNS